MTVTMLEEVNELQNPPNPEEVVILSSAYMFVLEEEPEDDYAEYI